MKIRLFHQLLRDKGSTVQLHVEEDHESHNQIFARLKSKIEVIKSTQNADERISLGYDLYLAFREFEADNLKHINEEERFIMPELQRLYTDEELRKEIDFKVYEIMTANDMFDMLKTLFPTYNLDDKMTFIKDLLDAQPNKLKSIWPQIASELLTTEERLEVVGKLTINSIA